jgi:two-component system, NtrC family, nitrogen regulation response regulator NtrX
MAVAKILIVDDEAPIRRVLKDILEVEKYEVHEAVDGMDAIARIKQKKFDVVFMDIKMPNLNGIEALGRVLEIQPDLPIIMISGHADVNDAVDTVRKGAFDFIQKPLDLNRLLITVRNALDKSNLVTETKTLRVKVSKNKVQEIIGESKSINEVREMIEKVAGSDARVLTTGPNGSGKELVARWLHEKSNRSQNPLVEVNCAAIPSELIESELFGHIKGSFTGAIKDAAGKFEQANGGTLFLDEIGDMSLSAQAKMLRVLETKKVTRIGDSKDISVDVRIVAATNKDLKREIALGNFREDLYFRLNVIEVNVPSLNQRREDIPLLINHFLEKFSEEFNQAKREITDEATAMLQNRNWSGNIRELRNVVERLMILGGNPITGDDIKNLVFALDAKNTKPQVGELLANLFELFSNADELQKYLMEEFSKHEKVVLK